MNFLQVYLFTLLCAIFVYSKPPYRLILTRAEIVTEDTAILESKMQITRLDRYTVALNGYMLFKETLSSSTTVQFKYYEFLSNEYRPFAINLEKSLCSFLKFEYKMMAYPDFVKIGAHMPEPQCPVLKGNYTFQNYTPSEEYSPSELPFKNSRIDLKIINGRSTVYYLRLYVIFDRDVVIRDQYS